jgi:arylsulfatase A-like enzyme
VPKKVLGVCLAVGIALAPACRVGRPPSPSGPARLADRLSRADIRESPLLGPDTGALPALFPLESAPVTEAGAGENNLGLKRKLNLGSAEVDILFAPPKSEYAVDVDIPENAALDFGTGIVRDANSEALRAALPGADSGVDFVVYLESGGRRKTLFERHLSLPPLREARTVNFSQNNVALPAGGRKGRIVLMTGGRGDLFSFWTNPVVYSRTRKRPNVILVSIDTLRADHVGAYGYDRATTPALDALAKDGALFLNAYASSPWTLPSHATLLTGTEAARHKVRYEDERLDPGRATLADLMRSAGYFCGAFTGGGFLSPVYGFSKGFSSYEMGQGDIAGPRLAEAAARAALPWLRTNADKEFFLFLHTYQVHSPYFSPPPYDTMFTGPGAKWKKFDTVENLGGKLAFFKSLSEDERRNVIGLYDGEIRYTDDALIGPLIAELKRLGLYDRTLLVVLSDHGEEFYEHGSWGHSHDVYDESLKVLLLMKLPGSRRAGARLAPAVRLTDVLPTVLEEAGVAFDPAAFDGRSLRPVFEGRETADRPVTADLADNVLGYRTPFRLAVSSGRDKLIMNEAFKPEALAAFPAAPPAAPPVELYDLSRDPGEKANLVADPAKARPARELAQAASALAKILQARGAAKSGMTKALEDQLRALGYIK